MGYIIRMATIFILLHILQATDIISGNRRYYNIFGKINMVRVLRNIL